MQILENIPGLQDPSSSDIDFSGVLSKVQSGSAPDSLSASQEDLLKDLEGLSMSSPDVSSANPSQSDDIDLLLSDFEGTISQIVLPEDAQKMQAPQQVAEVDDLSSLLAAPSMPRTGNAAQEPGSVTAMILPGQQAEEPKLHAAPSTENFLDTDLSSLIGGGGGGKSSPAPNGSVTRLIMPDEDPGQVASGDAFPFDGVVPSQDELDAFGASSLSISDLNDLSVPEGADAAQGSVSAMDDFGLGDLMGNDLGGGGDDSALLQELDSLTAQAPAAAEVDPFSFSDFDAAVPSGIDAFGEAEGGAAFDAGAPDEDLEALLKEIEGPGQASGVSARPPDVQALPAVPTLPTAPAPTAAEDTLMEIASGEDDFGLDELVMPKVAATPPVSPAKAAGVPAGMGDSLDLTDFAVEEAAAAAQNLGEGDDSLDSFLRELEDSSPLPEADLELVGGVEETPPRPQVASAPPRSASQAPSGENLGEFDFDEFMSGVSPEESVVAVATPAVRPLPKASPSVSLPDIGLDALGTEEVLLDDMNDLAAALPVAAKAVRAPQAADATADEISSILSQMDGAGDEVEGQVARKESSALDAFLSEIGEKIEGGDAVASAPVAAVAVAAVAGGAPTEVGVREVDVDVLLKQLRKTTDDDRRYQIVQRLGQTMDGRAVSDLLPLLNDENPEIREAAVESLGNIGDANATRPILKSLQLEEQNMRYLCVEALGKIGDDVAVDPIIGLLEERDENMRYVSAEALGRIASKRAVRPLMAMAGMADKDLRYIIAKALGQIRSTEACGLLLRFLDDKDPEVRVQSVRALGEIEEPSSAGPLIGLLDKEDEPGLVLEVVRSLGRIRSRQAVRHLVALLASHSDELVAEVITALGAIGEPDAVNEIVNKLQSSQSLAVQRAAAEALGRLGEGAAVPALVEVIGLGKEDLKIPVARSLGQLRSPSGLEALDGLLQDADVQVRQISVEALGAIEDPQCIPRLARVLKDPDDGVRRAAAAAMGKIGGEEAIPLLLELLHDESVDVSDCAVVGLERIGTPCVSSLIEQVMEEDSAESVRLKVVQVLGRIGDVRSVQPLVELFETGSKAIRDESCLALVQIDSTLTESDAISVVMKESYAWLRYGIAKTLGRYAYQEAVDLILRMIESTYGPNDMQRLVTFPDQSVTVLSHEGLKALRQAAAQLLGELNLENTVKKILERMVSVDGDVRDWLVYALGEVPREASVVALIELLKRNDLDLDPRTVGRALGRISLKSVVEKLLEAIPQVSSRVRQRMTLVLGMLRDTRALHELAALLRDPEEEVRLEAVHSLGRIASNQVFEALAECVRDVSDRVRRAAVDVLAKMPDERSIDVLGTALHDRDSSVRVTAARALGALEDPKILPILIAALHDTSSDVRESLVQTLGKLGSAKAVEPLIQMLKDIHSPVRQAAVRGLGKISDVRAVVPLLEAMGDHDLWVKTEAAKTLKSMGDRALSSMVQALGHPGELIQRHSISILSECKSPRLSPLLLDALRHRNKYMRSNAATVFGALGDRKAVIPLIALLDDRDFEVRQRAAVALGEIGDISASVALKQAQKDQNKDVRVAAAEALKRIMDLNDIA